MKKQLSRMFRSLRAQGLVFMLSLFLWNTPAIGQNTLHRHWSDVAENSITDQNDRQTIPERYRTIVLEEDGLRSLLAQAPAEWSLEARGSTVLLNLPLPDGTSEDFRIMESPIMAAELGAKYPGIKTYIGQGLADRTMSARFDLTPFGFHAIIFSTRGTIYIDPYSRHTTRFYISYFKHDLYGSELQGLSEIGPLGTDSPAAAEIRALVAKGVPRATGEELRTYRLALAATGEYTAFHGGTVPAGMAAIVTAMNRVNGIYERDISVRMVLIPNNDVLVFTNAATDPYTNNNGSVMLGQNQTTLDNFIGSTNYDIGHVFSTGGGGVAFLACVCAAGIKARGVTGLPSPIGDPFYVDYVAHEMGHQFGGNHSFNGNAGSCGGGNRNGSTAYEPGSGTTIMAYAGICGSQNIQNQGDDYFHGISIDEMAAYTQLGGGNSCPLITLTGNQVPNVDAGSSVVHTIPAGTPFVLTGSGSDPDGDSLTYAWEEFDLGPEGHPNTPSGDAPIFRSFRPTTSPVRTFPRLSNILSNTQTIGELLPSYSRIMAFRLTARDNRAGGGANNYDIGSIVVTSTAGPFQVTYPNTAIAWLANSTDSVTWNVANTSGSPINCTSVNILLSTDGGQTFPVTLASNTPNDGREAVTVPANSSPQARIKVAAMGNIFFDISNANFAIPRLVAPQLAYPADSASGQLASLRVGWNRVTFAALYHVQVARNPGFVTTVVVNDSTITDTSRVVAGLLTGTPYYWRVRAKDSTGTSAWSSVRTFTTLALPSQVTLVAPSHQATITVDSVLLQWNTQSFVDRYWLEFATDSTFATAVIDSALTDSATVIRSLQSIQTYWWKARAHNALGWGPFSEIRNFTTLITGITSRTEIPEGFSLEQNFPNPFNPSTVIRFGVPSHAHVRLEVFSTLGQRVAVLVDEDRDAGFHEIVFENPAFSSGVYIYRLSAEGYVQTRKLLLLK